MKTVRKEPPSGKHSGTGTRTRKATPPARDREAPALETLTCMHCRYEYPAGAPRCTICGYPWPWLERG